MAKKEVFYGVKVGVVKGVYTTWAEAEEQIKGFKGAVYKKFSDYNSAYDFAYDVEQKESVVKEEKPLEDVVMVYVDGSYKKDIDAIGYGVVFTKNNEVLFKDCGRVQTSDTTERNVTGEIYAMIRTIQLCVANDIKDIIVCYDYKGIECWATGEWKANKALTKRYVEYYKKYTEEYGLKIDFKYTKAHSNIRFNEEADKMAKAGALL